MNYMSEDNLIDSTKNSCQLHRPKNSWVIHEIFSQHFVVVVMQSKISMINSQKHEKFDCKFMEKFRTYLSVDKTV